MQAIRERLIGLIDNSCKTLGNIASSITQQQATTWRDSGDGWTVVEVMCHLRDYDEIFYNRAVMIAEEENPALPVYDHEAMAIEKKYNEQDLLEVYQALVQSRQRYMAFFRGLTEDQWSRVGIHPERGAFSLMDALVQVCTHDTLHLEQITRVIADKE